MKHLARLLMSVLVAAFMAVSVTGNSAFAQEKPWLEQSVPPKKGASSITKRYVDNDKVRVYDFAFEPGDVSTSRARPNRVIRYLSGGTFQRTYPDGKTDTIIRKAGEVAYAEAKTYEVKNIGKTKITGYVVVLKEK